MLTKVICFNQVFKVKSELKCNVRVSVKFIASLPLLVSFSSDSEAVTAAQVLLGEEEKGRR